MPIPHRRLLTPLAGALMSAACASGGGAPPAPTPTPTRTTPAPATPIPASGPAAFAYAPGTYRYEVRTDATVERPDARDERESVGSVAVVTYTLARQPRGSAVNGQVDSFTVSAGARVTAGSTGTGLAAPVPFRGTVDGTDVRLASEPAVETRCDGPYGAAVAAARETLVGVPATLMAGARWTDTTATVSCRGDVPATTQTIARYEVVGRAEFGGAQATRVRRQSVTTVRGTGVSNGQPVSITGSGDGDMSFYVDAARGRLVGATGESRTTLTVQIREVRQQFVQRSQQRITLR
jgi:hypothetical protein